MMPHRPSHQLAAVLISNFLVADGEGKDYGWAVAAAGAHLLGSLLMTALGIWTIQKLAA